MGKRLTVDDIGYSLIAGHYLPVVVDVNWFQVTSEGNDYYVYAGRLPEVFMEKRVSLDYFEYNRNEYLVHVAMDLANSQMSQVKVFQGGADDMVTFRVGMDTSLPEQFLEDMSPCLERLEQAVAEFGHACSVVVKADKDRESAELIERLSDPSPDNPWTRGKMTS